MRKVKYTEGPSLVRLIKTKDFDEVSIRDAIIDSDGTNLIEGTIIEGAACGFIELHETFDLDEISSSKVNELIRETRDA